MTRLLLNPPPPLVLRIVQISLLTSLAFLFLQSTATFDVSYTVRISFVFLVVACGLGWSLVLDGWRRLPTSVRITAGMLLAAYLLAWAFGDLLTVDSGRGGGTRAASYVLDLLVGLMAIGLVAGLWTRRDEYAKPLIALVVGAALASIYGIYQWFALRYGWPLSDVTDVVDSSGADQDSQGLGILGWERVRGTFQEPHQLAAYLAAILPIPWLLAARRDGRQRLALLAVTGALLAGLMLTSSFSVWVILGVAVATTGTVYFVARGYVTRAAVGGAMLVTLALGIVAIFTTPALPAAVTGRTEAEISISIDHRTTQWEATLDLVDQRPALGFGPGQSSVRFASEVPGAEAEGRVVLGTADGLWAASLIDVGVVGAACWVLFLGSFLIYVARGLLSRPDTLTYCLFLGAVVVILDTLVIGDRPPTQFWLMLGLAAGYVRARAREPSGSPATAGPASAT